MKDFKPTYASLLLALAAAAFAAAQSAPKLADESDPNAWKEFSSAGGGFAILFPGTPQPTTQVFKVNGKPLDKYVLGLGGAADYSVSYVDFSIPPDAVDAGRTILDAMSKTVAPSMSDSLRQSEITFDGFPARLLAAGTPGGSILRAKLVLKGSRLYTVAFRTSGPPASNDTGGRDEALADKFLNSFKLLPPPLPPGGEVERYLAAHRGEVFCATPYLSRNPPGCVVSDRIAGGKVSFSSKFFPRYPPLARMGRVTGTVVVAVIMNEAGKIIAAQAVSGNELLSEEVIKTVRKGTFEPALLDGKPVKAASLGTYNFVIQ